MMARMARRVNVMLVGNWVDEENQTFFVYTVQSEVRNKDSGMASRYGWAFYVTSCHANIFTDVDWINVRGMLFEQCSV